MPNNPTLFPLMGHSKPDYQTTH